ncbi:hypothetical protein DP187_21800 [Enterobacter cloacae]|nr:hypothetical protein DP187_21800 [Enterobacter cloacae]
MPLLTGLKVFVGGPIQHALEKRVLSNDILNHIQVAITVLESLGAEVFSAHRAEKFGAETHLFTPNEVSKRDRKWMEMCDIFVAVLPVCKRTQSLMRTDGTHIELGWASALHRPIVLVTDKPFDTSSSHLLKGLAAIARVEHIGINDFECDPHTLLRPLLAIKNDLEIQA